MASPPLVWARRRARLTLKIHMQILIKKTFKIDSYLIVIFGVVLG